MAQRSLDSIVEFQLDRPPRGNWWPRVFCPYGFPMVIETEPCLEDGTPFPTLFWLTCPYLKEEISRIESGPVKTNIIKEVRQDRVASAEELESESLYSEYLKRQGLNRELYIGGSRSPLTFKCIHALIAWYLVSHRGFAARLVLAGLESTYCEDKRCKLRHE
ncbi:MAG TPA: DUF501 domain-containing protein [Coprothermobacter sp.]|nr:DUF501 domain-containing protein [Coprothermobacter sp.]